MILSKRFEKGSDGDGQKVFRTFPSWFKEDTLEWKAVVADVDDADPTIPNNLSTCWLKNWATMVNTQHM